MYSLSLYRPQNRQLLLVGTLLGLTLETIQTLEDKLFTQAAPQFIEYEQFEYFFESGGHDPAPMVWQLASIGFGRSDDSCLLACIDYESESESESESEESDTSLRLEIQPPSSTL